jgi:hypothetical protein
LPLAVSTYISTVSCPDVPSFEMARSVPSTEVVPGELVAVADEITE